MIRLRAGNAQRNGRRPRRQLGDDGARRRRARGAAPRGCAGRRSPARTPSTAIEFAPASSAPSWAAASIPSAMPLTTVTPAADSPRPSDARRLAPVLRRLAGADDRDRAAPPAARAAARARRGRAATAGASGRSCSAGRVAPARAGRPRARRPRSSAARRSSPRRRPRTRRGSRSARSPPSASISRASGEREHLADHLALAAALLQVPGEPRDEPGPPGAGVADVHERGAPSCRRPRERLVLPPVGERDAQVLRR